MDVNLQMKLYSAIGRWMEENAQEEDWPTVQFNLSVIYYMTQAATTVFDSIVEAKEHNE